MSRAYPVHGRVIRARQGGSLINTTEIEEPAMNRHSNRRITQTALAAIAALSLLGASVTGAAAKPTIGTKKLKDNAVTTKKIKNGEVKTKDIGDGQIQMVDLSAALQAQLQPALELLDGSVTTPKLANGAVTTPNRTVCCAALRLMGARPRNHRCRTPAPRRGAVVDPRARRRAVEPPGRRTPRRAPT